MFNTSSEFVNQFPVVDVFFSESSIACGVAAPGIHRTHLIKSNGVNMLCCKEGRNPYLIRLKDVCRVSPVNNDTFICRFDDQSCNIRAHNVNTDNVMFTGPIRGRPDPTVNIMEAASQLGIDPTTLTVGIPEALDMDVAHTEVVTSDIAALVDELPSAATISVDFNDLDDLDVPDLSDF